MRNVEIIGKVLNVYDIREYTNSRGDGKVGSFYVGDETGTLRITCWHQQTEKIAARENNDRVEIHLSDKSSLIINPEGETIGEVVQKTNSDPQRKQIKDITEQDGQVELVGTVVQAFDPNFYEVCPKCNKRARQKDSAFVCESHGEVQPNYAYVLNVFLDDGTDNIRAVFFRQQVEKLFNKSQEELLQWRELPEKKEEGKSQLLGQIIKIQGKVVKNSMFDRLEVMVREVDPNPDPQKEIERLKAQKV